MPGHPFFKTLRGKAILFVFLISAVGLGTLLAMFIRTERSIIKSFQDEKLWLVENFVAGVLKPMMLTGHGELMSDIMANYQTIPDLKNIVIVRADGVEAFTDGVTMDEVNRRLGEKRFTRPPKPARLAADPADAHFQSALKSGAKEVYDTSGPQGSNELKMAFPILNEGECQGCHGGAHRVRGVLLVTFAMTKMDRQTLSNLILLSFMAVAVVLASSLGTLVFFNQAVHSRVSRIIKEVKGIVATEKFSNRITVESEDELTGLSIAFNHFISSVEGYRLAEEREKERLERTVAERTRELSEKNEFIESDLKVARRIQQKLMPEKFPASDTLDFHAVYLPCLHLGGDYYDVFEMPGGRFGICLADASGHGSSAALVVAIVKALVTTAGRESASPSAVVQIINNTLSRITPDETYCTLFYGVVDPRTGGMNYALAGHPPPFVINAHTRAVRALESTGNLVGIFDFDRFAEARFQLEPGDRLLAYTDGIVEAMHPRDKQQFGHHRLKAILEKTRGLGQAEFAGRLMESMDDFTRNAPLTDDITLLVVDFQMKGKINIMSKQG